MHFRKAFTLIELLVVIAIIAILSVVVVLTLNPAELLRQGRDANRVSDMDTLNHAIALYSTDQSSASGFSLGATSTVYISLPDPSATSTAGDQCQGLGLPTSSAFTYHCAASSTYRLTNGTGWIPVNFSAISSGSPFSELPIDPVNTTSTNLYYSYQASGTIYEVTSFMESQKYAKVMASDGGSDAALYEAGPGAATIMNGGRGIVAYWPMDEGTGSTALDVSGNNYNATWGGTASGTNGYYTNSSKVGAYAGFFNGANDYMQNSSTIFQPWPQFSYAVWFKTSVLTQQQIFNNWSYPGGASFVLDLSQSGGNTGKLSVYLALNSGTSPGWQYNISNNVADGNWHFAAVVYDGANENVYLDGTRIFTTPGSGTMGSGVPINIGVYGPIGAPAGFYFNGLIDDVRMYSRALSANEVQSIYNAER